MKTINFKKLILVLGIIIILNLFFNYGIRTFYDEPEFEVFCPKELTSKQYLTQSECEEAGGFWTENKAFLSPERPVPLVEKPAEPAGWCDATYACRQAYDDANDFYKRNVFIVLITLGIASIVVGFLVASSEAVSLGLSFGGLVSLIIGTIRYWSAMDDYLRFAVLGLSLAVLIWIGVKKFKNHQ